MLNSVAPAPYFGVDEEIVSFVDGDQVNLFRIIGLDMIKRFARNMSPRYNHYISRMDGRVNRKMLPMKDEIASFWALNNVG